MAESEMEEPRAAPIAGSIGRLADLERGGGLSARVRLKSSPSNMAPPLMLEGLQGSLPLQEIQGGFGLPAKAGSEVSRQPNILIQQSISSDNLHHRVSMI